MSKFTVIAMFVCTITTVASADVRVHMSQPRPMRDTPIALRTRANEYSIPDVGLVRTKDCTVSAYGSLAARITTDRGKSWVTFYDRAGEAEAQCEILRTHTPGKR